jgi:hypothetical protein
MSSRRQRINVPKLSGEFAQAEKRIVELRAALVALDRALWVFDP